jgi:DNA-binding LytR/AlgR family response regulator
MHIAVCDDNVADRKQMERLLQRASDRRINTTGVFYIDSYGNVDAVMRSPMQYDVFFIDMTSGPVNGFQVARSLIDGGVTAPIILCVSTIDYRSIITSAIAEVPEGSNDTSNHDILRRQLQTQIKMLDKPIKVAELEEMLEYALSVKAKTIPTIELRGEQDTVYVYEDEILYAAKSGNYAHVALTKSRSIDVLGTAYNLYTQLPGFRHFFLLSESAFINVTAIEKLSLCKILMVDGKHFNVSPRTIMSLKKSLQQPPTA